MIRLKSLANCRACTPYPRRSSNYLLVQNPYLSCFNANGLYEVNVNLRDVGTQSDERFYNAISSNYWCLVDCNRTVLDVPPSLSELRAFIVQSASPRNDRLGWRKKYSYLSIKYYMEPWSLPELIMGRVSFLYPLLHY